jgi:hypothetical protein
LTLALLGGIVLVAAGARLWALLARRRRRNGEPPPPSGPVPVPALSPAGGPAGGFSSRVTVSAPATSGGRSRASWEIYSALEDEPIGTVDALMQEPTKRERPPRRFRRGRSEEGALGGTTDF